MSNTKSPIVHPPFVHGSNPPIQSRTSNPSQDPRTHTRVFVASTLTNVPNNRHTTTNYIRSESDLRTITDAKTVRRCYHLTSAIVSQTERMIRLPVIAIPSTCTNISRCVCARVKLVGTVTLPCAWVVSGVVSTPICASRSASELE